MRPVLFEVQGVAFPAYGSTLVVLFIAGLLLLRRQGRVLGLTSEHMLELAGLASAVIFLWPVSSMLLVRMGFPVTPSFNALPVLAIGAFAFLSYLRYQRLPAEQIFDVIAPIAAMTLAIQYGVGTLLAGTAFGKPTALPWGISFPPGSPAHFVFGAAKLHPLQIYMGLGYAAVAAASWSIRCRLRPGDRALLTFVGIGVVYLATSPLRGNSNSFLSGGPTRLSEAVAAGSICYCILMLLLRRKQQGAPG